MVVDEHNNHHSDDKNKIMDFNDLIKDVNMNDSDPQH